MLQCLACGESNAASARFCQACGTPLDRPPAAAVEARKTVTVLFADMVESTSLVSALQPESARRVQDRFFEAMGGVIESHGGTVEKFIGDAVMAVFGVPVLHEDDALRAIRSALEMREALQRLNDELEATFGVSISMRVGVETGEVVATDPGRGQAFVTGEAVNRAARLEAHAAPGEVLLGEPTYRLVRKTVATEALGRLTLKGKTDGVVAHRLLGLRTTAQAVRLESQFVGRASELGALFESRDEMLSGNTSRLVTVIGTAGVGKSRLVEEFLGTCRYVAQFVHARCLPYGEGITFWPLKEAVAEAAGLTGDESADAARARIRALVADAGDADLIVERIAETIGIVEAVPEHKSSAWAARRLFEELARRHPVVLVLDDIQWAEPLFLDLVEHVVAEARGTPLLVVCMARPELLELRLTWASADERSRQVFLEPLSDDESGRLLESLLEGGELRSVARARIVEAADGLPLFVEEMVAMLREEGALRREDGHWVAGDLERLSAPATIQALLAARLDQLGAAERALLQRGAVEGQVFHHSAVVSMSPEDERGAVGARLSELTLKGLIEPATAEFADDSAFCFHHLLLRDVAYESVHKDDRAALHDRFAAWLDEQTGERAAEYDEIAGYHLEQACLYAAELRAGEGRSRELAERAGLRLGRAGLRAHARGDWSAAASLLSRALALLPDDSHRERFAPKLETALLEITPTKGGRISSLRCFLRWPPGHRWVVKERHGELLLRCTRCGKEKRRWSVPDGGPVGGATHGDLAA